MSIRSMKTHLLNTMYMCMSIHVTQSATEYVSDVTQLTTYVYACIQLFKCKLISTQILC